MCNMGMDIDMDMGIDKGMHVTHTPVSPTVTNDTSALSTSDSRHVDSLALGPFAPRDAAHC